MPICQRITARGVEVLCCTLNYLDTLALVSKCLEPSTEVS